MLTTLVTKNVNVQHTIMIRKCLSGAAVESNITITTATNSDHMIQRHIFLCCDQTKPKCCNKDVSLLSWEFLKKRLKELRLTVPIARTKANCLQYCRDGPIAVVYPEGTW